MNPVKRSLLTLALIALVGSAALLITLALSTLVLPALIPTLAPPPMPAPTPNVRVVDRECRAPGRALVVCAVARITSAPCRCGKRRESGVFAVPTRCSPVVAASGLAWHIENS